jgi:transcriptional regulator with XRE-family HTH domain
MQRTPATYIRTFRLGAGLSQKGLGALLGVSKYMVSRVECGKRQPTCSFMLGCSLLFGRPITALFPAFAGNVQNSLGIAAAKLDEQLRGRTDKKSIKKLALVGEMAKRSIQISRL